MVYGARCCSDAGQSRQEQFKSPGISVRVYKPSDTRDDALEGHHHHPIEHPQSTQSTPQRRPIRRPGRSHKSQNCCKSLSRTQASFHRVIVHMDRVRYSNCHLQMLSQEFLTRRFHDDRFNREVTRCLWCTALKQARERSADLLASVHLPLNFYSPAKHQRNYGLLSSNTTYQESVFCNRYA